MNVDCWRVIASSVAVLSAMILAPLLRAIQTWSAALGASLPHRPDLVLRLDVDALVT